MYLLLVIFIILGIVIYYKPTSDRHFGIIVFTILAFAIRVYISASDPFLHEWDERFHALVAKNMIQNPFKPMLRLNPVLSYDYTAWCCNHIWLHKQPLFLWQMALSMKLFGVNLMALRLPSIIMSTLLVPLCYRIGTLVFNRNTGLLAAFITTFTYYHIELSSGTIGMDHNDTAFMFYTTASLWAFMEYHRNKSIKWALLVGLLAGGAVLCKWLTGLLVFAGWFGYILANRSFFTRSHLQHVVLALIATLIIFLPWQIWIFHAFPNEAAYEFNYNSRHIFEVIENHGGQVKYYLEKFDFTYFTGGEIVIPIILILTFYQLIRTRNILRVPFIIFIMVPFVFFSFIVQTKLPSYLVFISPLILIACAHQITQLFSWINQKLNKNPATNILFAILTGILTILFLRPSELRHVHELGENTKYVTGSYRLNKMHNTRIFKRLNELTEPDQVIFNTKSQECIEAMFFSDRNVYHWCMKPQEYDTLKSQDIPIAVFQHHNNQSVPYFLQADTSVTIINLGLR